MVWSLLFTFLTTLIVSFTKKICETYWCSSSIACWEKRTDWILRIFTFNDKKPLYLPIISTLQFFRGSKWSRSNPVSHKTTWHIPNISNSEFKFKNAKFFQTLFCFSFIFLGNTSHKLWERSLSPPPPPPPRPLSMLFASIWDSFLAQAPLLLLFHYAATWGGGGTFFISAKWMIPEFSEIGTCRSRCTSSIKRPWQSTLK